MGAVFGLTVTTSVAGVVDRLSLASKAKLASAAAQSATMSAVMLPPVFAIFESVTPLTVADVAPLTLTVTVAFPPSSVTVAICELPAGEPCRLDKPLAAVIVGARLHPPPKRIERLFELLL